jgi:hypothetical protein
MAVPIAYTASVAGSIGSRIDGSSVSGLLTRVETGYAHIGAAGKGRIKSRGARLPKLSRLLLHVLSLLRLRELCVHVIYLRFHLLWSPTLYVTYFDEVKAIPKNGQNLYFVGGICVPMKNIAEFEKNINAMAKDLLGSIDLTPDTAFHARMVYFKQGPFKQMDFQKG